MGCGLFSHVDLTGVARHRVWSRIRVISFRYHGFPYSTVGDFLDPNIRVIRGPYCTLYNSVLIDVAEYSTYLQRTVYALSVSYKQQPQLQTPRNPSLSVSSTTTPCGHFSAVWPSVQMAIYLLYPLVVLRQSPANPQLTPPTSSHAVTSQGRITQLAVNCYCIWSR